MHPNLRAVAHLPPSNPISSRINASPTTMFARRLPIRALPSRRALHTTSPLLPRHLRPHAVPLASLPLLRGIATTSMAPGPMFSHPPPEPGADFNVVMVGAGVSILCHNKAM